MRLPCDKRATSRSRRRPLLPSRPFSDRRPACPSNDATSDTDDKIVRQPVPNYCELFSRLASSLNLQDRIVLTRENQLGERRKHNASRYTDQQWNSSNEQLHIVSRTDSNTQNMQETRHILRFHDNMMCSVETGSRERNGLAMAILLFGTWDRVQHIWLLSTVTKYHRRIVGQLATLIAPQDHIRACLDKISV